MEEQLGNSMEELEYYKQKSAQLNRTLEHEFNTDKRADMKYKLTKDKLNRTLTDLREYEESIE